MLYAAFEKRPASIFLRNIIRFQNTGIAAFAHSSKMMRLSCKRGLSPILTVVFRSKRGDRLKILVFDGSGLVMTYKRIETGRFTWPPVRDGVMHLSRAQMEALFAGLEWMRIAPRPMVQPAATN